MNFARTKIQPPRPRGGGTWIERPALDARLADALLAQRLVLVCAAAGYGKTTALARSLARLPDGTAQAWVSADADDDLHRLLDCLFAALEPWDPPWRTAPEALLAMADEPRGRARVAAELLNALDGCEAAHGVVVLDDLHRVGDGAVFAFLDTLLERLAPRWTIAIASRAAPPLALARLRAAGEIAEFREAQLRFDAAETAALARAAGAVGDAGATADALLARTCGWPAALRLALAHGGDAPAAGERAIRDFVVDEVLRPLPAELRDFLLRTAVLPELTATRTAAVSGDARAASLLDRIERLGLFVSTLDAAEPTLKLHDLLRDALLERLRAERPEEWPQLWRRAAAGECDLARRLPMLLAAGDLHAAAEALLARTPGLLTDGALATVEHLAASFPPGFAATSPALQQLRGLAAWARWDFPTMLGAMRAAEAGHAARGDADRAQAAVAYQSLALNALGRNTESAARLGPLRREPTSPATRVVVLVACIWHALDLGALQRIGPILDELTTLLEATDDAALWYQAHPLPRLNGLPASAGPLQRYVGGALRVAGERPMPLRALARTQAGWHQAWIRGDLDAAAAELAAVAADSRWLGDPPNVVGSALLLAAFVHALRGEREPALAAAGRLVDEHPRGRGPSSLWGHHCHAARIAARFDDAPRLAAHLGWLAANPSADGLAGAMQAAQLDALAGHRERLAGRAADAMAHWRRALEREDAMDRLGHAVETRLWLAALLADAGRRDAAAGELTAAAARVEAGAGVGAALFARPALRRLAAVDWDATPAADAARAFALWIGTAEPTPAPAAPAPGGLSAREVEVLARIAAGDSNKLIARALDLSPHTVKRHVANILDKLGAASRGQAAAWYRERRA